MNKYCLPKRFIFYDPYCLILSFSIFPQRFNYWILLFVNLKSILFSLAIYFNIIIAYYILSIIIKYRGLSLPFLWKAYNEKNPSKDNINNNLRQDPSSKKYQDKIQAAIQPIDQKTLDMHKTSALYFVGII